MLKMNAGEQSFNQMPFIIDYINELIVQLDYNIKNKLSTTWEGMK